MPKPGYYAVREGRTSGSIYTKWSDCERQVTGHSGAEFKKFSTPGEAAQFINQGGSSSGAGQGQGSGSGSQSQAQARK